MRKLTHEEEKLRKLYLRDLATGKIQGPPTGKSSIDMPWLAGYPEEAITDDLEVKTIYEYLYDSISDEPDRVLINYFGREITAGEILEEIDKTADYLKKLGVKPGDRVALGLAGMPEAIYCIYALNKLGAIAVNVDPRSNVDVLEKDMRRSYSKYYIGLDSTTSNIQVVQNHYHLKDVAILSPLRSTPDNKLMIKFIKGLSRFKEIIDGNYSFNKKHQYGTIQHSNLEDNYEAFDYENEKDLAVIVHTGGTTGVHKGVKISNYALNRTVHDHNYLVDDVVEVGDSLYNPLPPFMSYGMTTLHLSLCKKLYMYMIPSSNLKKFGDEISRLQPNIIYGGPIHYEWAKKSSKLKEKGLPNTKIIVSGGEKVGIREERDNNKFFASIGVHDDVYNGYGASEMCGVFSVKKGKSNSVGSVGYPFPHNNVKICDLTTGEELPYGKDGEILLQGDSLMLGYTDLEETKKVIQDNWFVSGDLGHINQNGELFVTGRKKRQFVSGVDKVYVPSVENVIESVPSVQKCVVVGVPDDQLRKVPYAYIQLDQECLEQHLEGAVEDSIRKAIKEQLPETSIPKYFDYQPKFKYNNNGKIDFITMEKEATQLLAQSQKVYRKQ